MIKKIKKPVSILLSLIMVFSLFTIVPFSASAAVGDVLSESEYLTFTAVEAGSSVTLKYANGTLKYNINNSGWQSYTAGTQITLADVGDYVRFSGKDTTFDYSNHFSLTGKVACSGNVMSLRLDDNGRDQGLTDRCFQYMFYNCIGLTTAPELPETTLADRCYYGMFQGCENLTKAPDLPATALANNCYGYMFSGCKSLTELPELPATNLAYGCYSYMFSGCTSLTTAPELPATTLTGNCYRNMFYGCTSLTTAPELPATSLESNCYFYMFSGCTSLTKAPELPATNLADSCYSNMFYGCTSLTELPALPATTLAASCYNYMFNNCSKICISDEAGTFGDITYSAEYRIPTTGEGSSAYNALYNMFRNTGGKFTGTPDINTTYYVPAPAPQTFKVYAKKLTGETYTIENLTGETTVAQLKEIIANQIDIPATAQRLVFGGKQLDDAKTLAEYNIEEESTIHLVIRGYTVTWLNYDNSELGTTTVQYGATPSYDGETPTKEEDADNTYTFSGWKNGETTYVLGVDDLPPVTGDVTYKAVYTADPKTPELPDVIAGCTYYDSYHGFYANVPFAVNFSDIKNGAISCDSYSDTEKSIQDTKDYSYKFYDENGTELQAENVYSDDSADGYGFRVIFNVFEFSNPISGPLYIVATAPETYTITDASVNGTVTASVNGTNVTEAEENADVTLTVAPAEGYQFVSISAGDVSLTTVTEGSQYSFTMPKKPVTVTAVFEEAPAPEPAVASVTVGGTTTEYTDFATAVTNWNSAADGATLKLLADINYNPSFSVTGTKTLDLNGHGITGTGTIAIAAGGNTTLTDSNPEAVHYFDVQNGYAVNINNTSGEKPFTGGYLAGGTGDWGSAIQISGTLTMDGGTILGNTSNYSGAVRVHSNATFIMTGGQIIYNRCAAQRGGNDASLNAESNAVIKFSGNPVIKNNVNPAGKPANVMVRSTLAKKINVIGTLTDGAEIGITMQNNSGNDYTGAFTASDDTSLNDASKFFSDNSSYAVHKNDAGQLYLSKKLIVGHTLSLEGNIAINFYLDPAAAGMTANQVTANNFSYSFAWANGNALVGVAAQSGSTFTVDGNYIKVTCHVCAAEMTCGVNASFTLGNKTESEVYSVRKYGDSVLNPTADWLNDYKSKYPDNSRMCYANLVALVTKMLDYGAKAQTVFGIKTGDPANTGLDYTMSSDTPDFDAAIQKANRRLADNPASSDFYGENFKAPSLVFLDYSTLKLYFENKDGSLSTSGLTPWNNYFYIKHENIAASQLDTLQTFTVSGKTFRYSALDYAKVLAASENTDNANLAKALYWYNKAANAYFG